ncbi:hypothetical protein LOTGIDRAFT_237872 [Lottia gigantea]|uniref:Uncharacterized protein n=1 Tax=Lottia gigantea TaxID=225164 RepID=V4AYF9_LOTGI|nr:hypothetical protein LOTGIDRAFT_237872 [Lottia gigantea]ESP02633.1 hypothetical protein LOTGIDRAFT_237872 [Lottia gigantea]
MAYFPLWYIVWVVIGAVTLVMLALSIYKAQMRYKNRISVVHTTQRAPIQVTATSTSNAPLPPPYPPMYPPPSYNEALNQSQYPPVASPFRPGQMTQGQPTIEYGPGAYHK